MKDYDDRQFAEVIVEVPNRQLDRPFHYSIPSHLQPLSLGNRVLVPFGQRSVPGYIIGFSLPPAEMMNKIKPIKERFSDGLTPELLALAKWIAHKYLCTLAESFFTVLGAGRDQIQLPRKLYAQVTEEMLAEIKIPVGQKRVLSAAIRNPGLKKTELAKEAEVSVSTVSTVIKKGWLSWQNVSSGEGHQPLKSSELPQLTGEQEKAVRSLRQSIDKGEFAVFLLHGVTGSGKTEVYLRAIDTVIKKGRQAIVLLPEIALTPQMVGVFQQRFGSKIAVLHSRMSGGERYAERLRIQKGEVAIVLGARSAVFAPVPNLGIIVVDEEHEPLYKQEDNPKYHVRDVALYRAQYVGGVVVLGSATPSLESYCRSEKNGPYKLLTMPKRVSRRSLPEIEVVDMRQELSKRNTSIFSKTLLEKMLVRLQKGEQTVLFLNRRGFATFVFCRQCGHVMKCPHCDISLTYHQNGMLRCHYCNYQLPMPQLCPNCQQKTLQYIGTGTQKVEQEVLHHFPQARVLRMDGDTTGRKDAFNEMFSLVKSGKVDVLVGTQMIAKGLDIPSVTLVGVVSADSMLYMPDFRASERAFQLLTQVAGRSGRGTIPGETIIQTYTPEHYSINYAQNHDYLGFYQREMNLRRDLKYPPFYYLARILVWGEDLSQVEIAAREIKEILDQVVSGANAEMDLTIMGPAPAALARIKMKHRWQLMIKGKTMGEVRMTVSQSIEVWEEKHKEKKKVGVSIDIDPQFLM